MSVLKYITLADLITILNALVGFLAIMYVIDGLFNNAFIFILFAIILDGLDGSIARMIRSKHTFGVYLDAIADTVSFCFAPAVLLYAIYYVPTATSFNNWVNLLTVLATFSVVGLGILRLARFIMQSERNDYFIGLPTPAFAMFIVLLLLPVLNLSLHPEIVLPMIIITSLLMVSDVYYPKFRGIIVLIMGLIVSLVILSLLINFRYYDILQVTALGLVFCYIFMVPFFVPQYRKVSNRKKII